MPTSYPSSSSGLSRFFFPTKFFGLLLNCFTSVFRKYRPVSKISLWRRSAQAFSCLDQSNLEPWAPREERPIFSWQPLFRVGEGQVTFFPLQKSPNWHCIPLVAVSRIQQLLQYLEHNSNNLIHRTGKQISEISWPPLFCPRETLARIPEKLFASKSFEEDWQGRERQDLLSLSLQGGDYTPLTGFRLFSAAAACRHHACQTQRSSRPRCIWLPLEKVGRPTCEPRQIGLTDAGGLLD